MTNRLSRDDLLAELAVKMADHFADAALPRSENPADYLADGEGAEFYRGYIAGRQDAADSCLGELSDTMQEMAFWKHDIPMLIDRT